MIYFVQRPSDWAIKIGTTIRLTVRLGQIRKAFGDCKVLAVMDGGYADEYALHQQFRSLNVEGEWFTADPRFLAFIETEGRPWDGIDEAPALGSVKLRMEVIETARIVAGYTGESMTDMLSDILGPILAKREQEEVAKRLKATKSRGG
jgi:hypothetical protein